MSTRIGPGLLCALVLTGCASAIAFRVDRSDVTGPCQTAIPDRDVLFGVALSGGGSRAALFTVIALRHTEAKWAADLSDLPPACKAEGAALDSPEEVRERIAEIPTRLVLNSECDRQLLFTAASKLVDENRDRILEFLDRPQS